MKKQLFMFMLCLLSMQAFSQENSSSALTAGSKSFADRIMGSMEAGFGTKSDGMSVWNFDLQAGYRFVPRVYVFAKLEAMVGLRDNGGAKTYANSCNLGGGLGWRIFDQEGFGIDLKGSVSSSVGNAEWKNTAYDARFVIRMGTSRKLTPMLSLGYRYADSRTPGISNYSGFVGGFGFCF